MKIPKLNLTIASGIILLALVLHFFEAFSLPFIQPLYIVETSLNSNDTKQEVTFGSSQKLTQIRLGNWAACLYSQNNSVGTCFTAASGYNVTITQNRSQITVVESSWTGGLSFQVFAGGCTLVAFVLAHFFSHSYRFVTLIAVGVAGGMSLTAFLIEIALFLFVKGRMQTLGAGATTNPGPGFWMTFIPAILLGAAFLWLFFRDKPSIIDQEEDQKLTNHQVDSTPAPDHQPKKLAGMFSKTFTPVSPVPQNPHELFKPQAPQGRSQGLTQTWSYVQQPPKPEGNQGMPGNAGMPHGPHGPHGPQTYVQQRPQQVVGYQTTTPGPSVPPPQYTPPYSENQYSLAQHHNCRSCAP